MEGVALEKGSRQSPAVHCGPWAGEQSSNRAGQPSPQPRSIQRWPWALSDPQVMQDGPLGR